MSNSGEATSVWPQPQRRPESDGPPDPPPTNNSQESASYDSQAPSHRDNHTRYSNTNMGRGSRKRLIRGSIYDIPGECYGHLVGRGGEFARFMTAGDDKLTSYHVEQQKQTREGPITIKMSAVTQENLNRARSYLIHHIDSYFDRND